MRGTSNPAKAWPLKSLTKRRF
uniref:Uncharacterized protein n=1 Tax=Rhizophora mucronata TaxID=61149 RepID=A0A2P2PLN3_RHIMU